MFVVNECFIKGKNNKCEDLIIQGERYVAIIDGCTSENKITYDGLSGGEKAAQIIGEVISKNDKDSAEYITILNEINYSFRKHYEQYGVDFSIPENKMGGVLTLFDKKEMIIYCIGDGQILMIDENDKEYYISDSKEIDAVTSNTRSLFNNALIASGKETVQSLMENDKGREFIIPLIQSQSNFENKLGEFGYGVLNGDDIPNNFIKKIKVNDNIKQVTLASDGYPKIFNNLNDTEKYLNYILKQDPLMIGLYKSTKGLLAGNNSFDDRSYISILISP